MHAIAFAGMRCDCYSSVAERASALLVWGRTRWTSAALRPGLLGWQFRVLGLHQLPYSASSTAKLRYDLAFSAGLLEVV